MIKSPLKLFNFGTLFRGECKADLHVNSLRQNQTQEFSFFDARDLKFDCEKGLKLSKMVDEKLFVSD